MRANHREVLERLAEGHCVDEGEKATDWEGLHPVMGRHAEDRAALIEFDPGAAVLLWKNPPESVPEPYRSAMIELANDASPRVRDAVAKAMAAKSDCDWLHIRPTPTRELSAEDFDTRFQVEVASMVSREGMTRTKAEIEFCWRYAEEQTGVKRDGSKNLAQKRLRNAKNAAYQRLYRKY